MGICDPALGDHVALVCATKVGGIEAAIFIDCAITVADPTDEVEIAALIAANTAELVEPVRGEEPEPEDIALTNADGGGELERITTHRRTIILVDNSVTAPNIGFYNALDGAQKQVILRYHEDKEQRAILLPVLWKVVDTTPSDKFTVRQFTITGTYTSKDMQTITPELVGIYTFK